MHWSVLLETQPGVDSASSPIVVAAIIAAGAAMVTLVWTVVAHGWNLHHQDSLAADSRAHQKELAANQMASERVTSARDQFLDRLKYADELIDREDKNAQLAGFKMLEQLCGEPWASEADRTYAQEKAKAYFDLHSAQGGTDA